MVRNKEGTAIMCTDSFSFHCNYLLTSSAVPSGKQDGAQHVADEMINNQRFKSIRFVKKGCQF